MDKIPIIAIVGPTAVGKTRLSLEIAQKFPSEIVSADSMQIYKEFNILTAKPTQDELHFVKHHMINIVSVKDSFSVADYVKLAKNCIKEIWSKNKIPILVGGTGLYVDSFLKNVNFEGAGRDDSLRNSLLKRVESGESLYEELTKIDPKSAAIIHRNDTKRIIRALEFYYTSGYPISQQVERSKLMESPYDAVTIGINFKERALLYDNINERVDKMVKNGLVNEVEAVSKMEPSHTATCSIGYKEIFSAINGQISLKEATECMKKETRRYAKRQITWFKRNKNVHWMYLNGLSSYTKLRERVIQVINQHLKKA